MSQVTLHVFVKDKPRRDKSHAVVIRITRFRRHAYLTTSIGIKPSDYNPKGTYLKRNWIKSQNHNHKTYNETLEEAFDKLIALADKHPELTAKELKAKYEEKEKSAPEQQPRGLMAFWQVWIDRKRSLGKEGTAVLYETSRNYLLGFTGPDPDESQILTRDFAARYLAHLRTATKTKQAYSPSTCNEALGQLNTVYTNGVLEGWVEQAGNPFADMELTVEPSKRQRPTHAQVMAMKELELTPDLVEYDARNCFLLQYFLHGARVSEALHLEWSEVTPERVEYRPKKRSRRLKSIAMNPGLRWVLERCERNSRWVLPYMREEDLKLTPTQQLNRLKNYTEQVRHGLSKISKRLGLPFNLTSHMARHAFTDKALEELSDLRVVQEMLGHASIRTTERYVAELKLEKLDQASSSVYGSGVEENNSETFGLHRPPVLKARKGRKRK